MITHITPMKPYPCIESTIDFYYANKLIRLWIDEQEVLSSDTEYPVDDIVNGIMDFLGENKLAGPKEVAAYVAKEHGRVNAMQIKDDEGGVQRGVVIYFKDFNSDIHG